MSLVMKLALGMAIGGASLFAQTVSCNSDDMRRHYCSADTRDGVQLVRQRSDAACIEGRTWGYDRRGIWVDRGCRAEFALGAYGYNRGGYGNSPYGGYPSGGYGNNYPYGGGYNSTLTCSSDDMRRHYCSADTSGGVSLLRQRSDASCVEGRTWGYDRRGVWVDRGCRADFAVGTAGGYDNRGYGRGRQRGWGRDDDDDRDRDRDRDRYRRDPRYDDRRWPW